jgi:two-component system chemotaxis sensor kinase CheA
MIEDEELRSLFKMESEEHLQHLDEGLLRLESTPQDSAILEEVFRAAHSLKGAARMLGVSDVETIAHHFEDALGAARRGRTVLSSESIDRLYGGLDAIRALVQEAVTGDMTSVNVERVLAQLNGDAPTQIVEVEASIGDGAVLPSQTSTAIVPSAVAQPIAGGHLPVVNLLVAQLPSAELQASTRRKEAAMNWRFLHRRLLSKLTRFASSPRSWIA